MLLSIKDLKVNYGGVEAIKGISIEVERGTIVSLIGANGAGKSTILRTVSGLKKPSSGHIYFMDNEIGGMPPHAIVKMGISHVPEGKRVFPYMTVMENIKIGAYLRKSRTEVSRDLDELFGHFPRLKERARQRAGTLSGGEQQMLVMARALIAKPRLLLMDEPSLGLSPIMVAEVGKIIQDIYRQGLSILLVEQNARLALRLAHKAYVLETGSVVAEGAADELMNNEMVRKAYLGT